MGDKIPWDSTGNTKKNTKKQKKQKQKSFMKIERENPISQ